MCSVFFFKQKTAYEMRISDWSSDVCSSDLDRCTRLMYRGKELFINGEVARAGPSRALRRLADERELDCAAAMARALTDPQRAMLADWLDQGWLHYSSSGI